MVKVNGNGNGKLGTLVTAGTGDPAPETGYKRIPAPSADAEMRNQGSQMAARYGSLVITNGFVPLPNALFYCSGGLGLEPQHIWLVASLLLYRWTNSDPHPSLREIARRSTLHHRQVKYLKSELCERGYMRVEEASGPGGTNVYDLSPLFESIIAALEARGTPVNEIEDSAPDNYHEGGRKAQDNEGKQVAYDDPIPFPLAPPSEQRSQTTRLRAIPDTLNSLRSPSVPGSTGSAGSTGSYQATLPIAISEPASSAEPASDLYSFEARYGRVIMRAGIAPVPKALFRYQAELKLRPAHVWLTCYILSYQWGRDLPYPSLRKISHLSGQPERALYRVERELSEAGYLRVIPRYDRKLGRDTNAFDFSPLWGALEQCVRREAEASAQSDAQTLGQEQFWVGHNYAPPVPQTPAVSKAPGRFQTATLAPPVQGQSARPRSIDSREQSGKATSLNRAQEKALRYLGMMEVLPEVAQDLVARYAPDFILRWIKYVRRQKGLDNPAGFLVKRIKAGQEAPGGQDSPMLGWLLAVGDPELDETEEESHEE